MSSLRDRRSQNRMAGLLLGLIVGGTIGIVAQALFVPGPAPWCLVSSMLAWGAVGFIIGPEVLD